jgi:hypothetical protein
VEEIHTAGGTATAVVADVGRKAARR